jgi:hypothetical protein
MFVIDDIILAEAAAAFAPEMVAAMGAGEAAAGAGALEAAMGAEALGVPAGFEAAFPAGLEAAGLAAAEQGAFMYPGIPPAAATGPQAGLELAQVGSAPKADAIATGIGPEAAADRVAGVVRTPEFQQYIDAQEAKAAASRAAPFGYETDYVSGAVYPKAPPSAPTTTEPGMFDKAMQWAKKNPGLAISGGMMGLSAIDRMLGNRGGLQPSAPYSGPLSKYKLSPDFKGRYVDPRDYRYTPSYNYAGGGPIDSPAQSYPTAYIPQSNYAAGLDEPPPRFAKGGEAASAMMDMYERMMRRSPTLSAGDSPDAPRSVGIVQDADPDTRNLDALRATQVRMAKLRKRAGLAPDKMPSYTSLGAMNVGLGKADGAAPEMAKGGMLGTTGLGDYAAGGNPRLLKGPGDGMSDDIPATINDKQPARLADGEFVVPADVVSHLGNGSTDAGAKKLHDMMTKVREARTGNPKQGKQIKADKYLPK